ncbi:TPA: hypothetical protein J8Y49_002363 [Enterococcus faecium]|nr:hypothetical protein [Enterococcus faecium]
MSEVEKALTDAYYWLSMYKSGAITEGVAMEKVKKAIFAQPQLNENQQQVIDWLKDYYKENRPFTTAFGAIMNIASKRWMFIKQNLTENQQEQVLQTFIQWVLEQEEE